MSNLKDYRVSLKFSDKDPEQAEVVNMLKQMGRRKSAFITKAVKYYMENNPQPEIPGANMALDRILVESLVKNILKNMNVGNGQIPNIPMIQQSTQQQIVQESIVQPQVTVQEEQHKVEKTIEVKQPESIVQKPVKTITPPKVETKIEEPQIESSEEDIDDFLSGLDVFDQEDY